MSVRTPQNLLQYPWYIVISYPLAGEILYSGITPFPITAKTINILTQKSLPAIDNVLHFCSHIALFVILRLSFEYQ